MSFVHNTPIVVRKRKFARPANNLQHPHQQKPSKAGKQQQQHPMLTKQRTLDPRLKTNGNGNGSGGHWADAPTAEDSTQKETGEAVRGITMLAASFFNKMSGSVKKLLSPQTDGPFWNDTDPESTDGKEEKKNKKNKKRRILEEGEQFQTPARNNNNKKSTVTRERLDATTFKPEIKDQYSVSFTASPIPWDMDKLVQPQNDLASTSSKAKSTGGNYGTNFISHKRDNASGSTHKSQNKHNIHSEHLHSVYKGTYKSPLLQSPSPSPSIQSTHESVIQRISSLTEAIKTTFNNRRSKDANGKELPDLIFIREQRIKPSASPPPTRSQLSLKFDDSQLTFADEYKYYQRKLKERQLEHERIHKEAVEAATKKVSSLIPIVSEEEEEAIIDIWKSRGLDGHLLATVGNTDVFVRDFKTLADGRWLNDTVIEAYLKTVDSSSVHSFTPFFFTNLEQKGYAGVGKWLKRAKKQLKDLKRILVPINVGSTHWVSAVIDLENKKINYMDSLNTEESPHGRKALALLQLYLNSEAEKQGVPHLAEGFEARQLVDGPQQPNGYDCGVFTLMNLLHLSQGTELSYDSSESKNFRRVVANTILTTTKRR